MRKLLYACLGLAALVVTGLLVGPSLFDWNSYKPQITTAVKDRLGRNLRIAGDIYLSLLPSPSLSVKRVSFENVPGADNREMLAFDEVEVNVDISSLLQGKIVIQSVRLVRPIISLEVTKDGRSSWDMKFLASNTDAPVSQPNAPSSGSSGRLWFDISLESVNIEDATITYFDARSEWREEISNLTSEIKAASLYGPFEMEGKASARQIPTQFQIAIGKIKPTGPLPVKLKLSVQKTQAQVELKGTLNELTPDAILEGKVKARAANLTWLAEQVDGVTIPLQLAESFNLEAEIIASATTVGMNNLSLRLGDMSFAGAIHSVLSPQAEIDIVMNANKIDLGPFLDKHTAKTAALTDSKPNNTTVSPKIPMPVTAIPRLFALPEEIAARFELGVQMATYNDRIIRDTVVRGTLQNGLLRIERFSAALPSSSGFKISGTLTPVEGVPQFVGDIALNSNNLRGLINWLGVNQAVLPQGRLRNFSYTSKLRANPKKAYITAIAMQLDASQFSGGMIAEFRPKPGIGLRLAVDKLNLDAYFPKTKKVPTPSLNGKPATVTNSSIGGPQIINNPAILLQNALNLVDANIELSADQIIFMGETARNTTLNATIFEREIVIHQASIADFAGVDTSFSGSLNAVGETPKFGVNFKTNIRNFEHLSGFTGIPSPLLPKPLGSVSGEGRIDGTLAKATMKVTAKAAGAQFKLDGTIEDYLAKPKFNLTAAVTHPDLNVALRKFAPTYSSTTANLGPFAVRARLLGTSKDISLQEIDAEVGPIAITGRATLAVSQKHPNITADLKTSEVLLDLFLKPSPSPTSASSIINNQNTDGSISLRNKATPVSKWSNDTIGIRVPTDIEANLKLEMTALTFDKLKLEQPRLHAVMNSGQLAIKSFNARIFDGKLKAKADIEPRGKMTGITAEVSVAGLNTRKAVKKLLEQDRVTGPLSLFAKVTTAGNSEKTFISALNGNATVQGQAQFLLTKEERNTLGFAAVGSTLLSTLLGNKVNALSKIAPISQLITSLDQAFGRNPASVSGQFQITNGVAQTNNLTLSGQGNVATTKATIDFPRWQFASLTELVDDPKQEPLVTFDASGPLDAPSKTKVGGRLLRSGLSKVQQQVTNPLQKFLPGILGRGSSSQSSDESQQQQKIDPGSLLQGILRNLKP